MAINCEKLNSILRDCSNALGGINQQILFNDSKNVDFDGATIADHEITAIALEVMADGFEVVEFRKNLATLNEDYANNPDGAVMFEQTLVIPVHGRDAAKSKKISVMAAGQRELDIIVPQNDGGYVYLRQATLTTVADGTGAAKADGSKYTLTFTAQSEELAYFIDPDIVSPMVEPIVPISTLDIEFTSGTDDLEITYDGVTYTGVWDTDGDTTIDGFISTNGNALGLVGFSVSRVGSTLQITGSTSGLATFVVVGSFEIV